MPQRSQTRLPVVSSPMTCELGGMDWRPLTSRNGAENGTTPAAISRSTAIYPQRSLTIFQTPTLPIVSSHEDSCSDIGHSLDPFAYFPEDDSFTDFVSPFYDAHIFKPLQQDLRAPVAEDINFAQMFTSRGHSDMYPEEVVVDSESATHEAPEPEDASHEARRDETNQRKRRDRPLTEEEKKERNRKYSKRYREKLAAKKVDTDNELVLANNKIQWLQASLMTSEAEIQRRAQREYELEMKIQSLCQRLNELEGFTNACFLDKETGQGNLETRDSHMSDGLFLDDEHTSSYPISPNGFPSPFQS